MKQVNLRIYQTILPLLFGLFLSLGAIAQQVSVKGHVKDATGEPVIGANVLVKGTTNGTITDMDGRFELDVPNNATLQVSYIGFNTQEIVFTGQPSIEVQLVDDTQA